MKNILRGLLFCLLFGVTDVCAEPPATVIKFSSPGLSLSGSAKDQNFEINIQAKTSKSTSVFLVETPYRLVVDLFGVQTSMLKKIRASEDSIIKSARIGSHKDKTRIVFDLAASTPPSFSWKEVQGGIRISIGSGAAPQGNDAEKKEPSVSELKTREETEKKTPTPTAAAALPTSTPVPTVTPSQPTPSPSPLPAVSPSATPSPSVTPSPSNTPAATPTSQPSPTETAKPPTPATETPAPTTTPAPPTAAATVEQTSAAQVESIAFEITEVAGPALVVSLNTHPEFRLSRKSDRAWLLTIPRVASRDPRFGKPWFPSEEFAGFAYFRVTRQGAPAEIEIGVERNMKIVALPDKERIIVKIAGR